MVTNRILSMLIMAVVAALPSMARDNGGKSREVRSTVARGIDAISLSAPVTVELVPCSGSCDDDGLVSYTTAVADDPLVISRRGSVLEISAAKTYARGRDMKIKSSVKVRCGHGIKSVMVSGSGDVKIQRISVDKDVELSVTGSGDIDVKSLKAAAVKATVTGSGDIDIKRVAADRTYLVVTGSGDIDAEGSVQKADLTVTGSGDIDVRKLQTGTMTINLSGSGDVKCESPAELTSQISGSGNITVYGRRPARVNLSGNTHNVKFVND